MAISGCVLIIRLLGTGEIGPFRELGTRISGESTDLVPDKSETGFRRRSTNSRLLAMTVEEYDPQVINYSSSERSESIPFLYKCRFDYRNENSTLAEETEFRHVFSITSGFVGTVIANVGDAS